MHSSTEHCVAPPQVEKRQSSLPRPANSSELAQSGPAAAKEPAQAETLGGLFVRRFTRLQATTSASVCMQTWKPLLMLKTGSHAIGLDSGRPISDDKLSPPPTVGLDALRINRDPDRRRRASAGRAHPLPRADAYDGCLEARLLLDDQGFAIVHMKPSVDHARCSWCRVPRSSSALPSPRSATAHRRTMAGCTR